MSSRLAKSVSWFLTITLVLFLISCSENLFPPEQNEDYFPINSSFVYTFQSNAISNNQDSLVTFDMKIDNYTFSNGTFLALQAKLKNNQNWGSVLALKDSNNIIYSLGDNPPEGLFPMFKHKYDDNEVTNEDITIDGKNYKANRLDVFRDNVNVSWWFVDGIGLVKEESSDGVSLFSDDHYKDNYLIKTELVSFQK